MWTCGFFDSVNGDRLFNASQISEMFEGLITDGVFATVGNKLAVQSNGGMSLTINTGLGWFGGRWVRNTALFPLTLEPADVLLNRYCAVCVRTDLAIESRTSEPYLKYSDFAVNPTKPTMIRTDEVKEYCLAYVYIPAGAAEVTASNITDTRGDNNLCGWVTGLIEQLDSATLFEQFEAMFLEWFEGLNNYLDDNVAAKLSADMLQVKATVPIKATGTIDGLGWDSQSDGSYIQTITVNGVTSDNDIIVCPADRFRDSYTAMDCEAISQGNNTVTFRCYAPADVNITVKVIIFNNELTA